MTKTFSKIQSGESGGEGLRLEHVQGHPGDQPVLRRPDDVRRPDSVAAAEVVEEGGTLHQPEMPAGEEAVGLLVLWKPLLRS